MKKILGIVTILGLATYAVMNSLKKEDEIDNIKLSEAKAKLEKLKQLRDLDVPELMDKNFDIDCAIAELERFIDGFSVSDEDDEYNCKNDSCCNSNKESYYKEDINDADKDLEDFIFGDVNCCNKMQTDKSEEIKAVLEKMFPNVKVRIPSKEELDEFMKVKSEKQRNKMEKLNGKNKNK